MKTRHTKHNFALSIEKGSLAEKGSLSIDSETKKRF